MTNRSKFSYTFVTGTYYIVRDDEHAYYCNGYSCEIKVVIITLNFPKDSLRSDFKFVFILRQTSPACLIYINKLMYYSYIKKIIKSLCSVCIVFITS